jgi:type IV pilus assembly protein PilM
MDEAVQWAVRRHIPFDLDRVYIDWEELELTSELPQHKQVLVGAAQRDVVDPLLAVLDSIGFNVVALELEAQAVMRCLLPRSIEETRDIRGVLVIDLGATSTNVILFDQGAMRFTASVQLGGDDLTQQLAHSLNLSLAEAMEIKVKVDAGFAKTNPKAVQALQAATLNLARMVERAVQEMTVQLPPDQRVRTILLTGGNANLSGIKELFGQVFTGIPVQYGNPRTNLQQENKKTGLNLTIGDAMHFTTAIGLALRQVDY